MFGKRKDVNLVGYEDIMQWSTLREIYDDVAVELKREELDSIIGVWAGFCSFMMHNKIEFKTMAFIKNPVSGKDYSFTVYNTLKDYTRDQARKEKEKKKQEKLSKKLYDNAVNYHSKKETPLRSKIKKYTDIRGTTVYILNPLSEPKSIDECRRQCLLCFYKRLK